MGRSIYTIVSIPKLELGNEENDGDIINDSDNLGKIIFEGETLSTAIYDENKKVYVSSIGEYSLEDTTLTFTSNAGKKLIIENFDKNSYSLGINLTNEGRTFSFQTLYSNADEVFEKLVA